MLRNFFRPPIFQDDPGKTREAGISHNITLFLWIISLPSLALINLLPAGDPARPPFVVGTLVASAIWLGSLFAIKRGYHRAVNITIIIFNLAIFNGALLISGGLGGPGVLLNFLALALAFLLLPQRGIILVALVASLFTIAIYLGNVSGVIPLPKTAFDPLNLAVIFIFVALTSASVLEIAANILRTTNARAAVNETGLFDKVKELEALSTDLENQVASRTRDLELAYTSVERRARQFEAISQVSRAINKTKGLEDLLPVITQVISQQFNFYHIGIFLLDLNAEFAMLSASNSEGGQRMLDRSHRLKVGREGIVGDVAATGAARIALDTGADAIYFNNPDLPETRSELALPLFRTGQEIIGVLDVQSLQANAFGQEDIQILTTLADQVSIALANARLYEETQKALIESETLYRRDIRSGWIKFTRAQKLSGIRRQGYKTDLLLDPVAIPGALEVTRSGNPYQRKSDGSDKSEQLTIPMKLRGEVVGLLNIKSSTNRVWNADEMDIVNAIIDRAALSIDNARLLAESRKLAEKERVIGEISSKVSSFSHRENILQAAVSEIGRALPGAEVVIQLQKKNGVEGA
jgi:GAF domain-containing protein